MKEKYFNYIYIITNIINGHQYIGEHSTNKNPDNDNYLGSGHLLNKKIKQYGKENFKKEILEQFNTKQEAFNAQEKYIKLYKTHISYGGYNKDRTGGWCVNKECSEETRKKQSKIRKGKTTWMCGKHHTDESKKKLREARKLQIPWNKGTKGLQVAWNKGKPWKEDIRKKQSESHKDLKQSQETKEKRNKKLKGKIPWNKGKKKCFSDETLKKLSKVHKGKPNGFQGKHHKKESIKKISITMKNKPKIICEYCNRKISNTSYIRWHGDKCKSKIL
jgi:group I intron endonuclease